jgi:hypothetical protein
MTQATSRTGNVTWDGAEGLERLTPTAPAPLPPGPGQPFWRSDRPRPHGCAVGRVAGLVEIDQIVVWVVADHIDGSRFDDLWIGIDEISYRRIHAYPTVVAIRLR